MEALTDFCGSLLVVLLKENKKTKGENVITQHSQGRGDGLMGFFPCLGEFRLSWALTHSVWSLVTVQEFICSVSHPAAVGPLLPSGPCVWGQTWPPCGRHLDQREVILADKAVVFWANTY